MLNVVTPLKIFKLKSLHHDHTLLQIWKRVTEKIIPVKTAKCMVTTDLYPVVTHSLSKKRVRILLCGPLKRSEKRLGTSVVTMQQLETF